MNVFLVLKANTRPPKPKTKVKGAHKAKRVDALSRRMQSAVSADLLNGLNRFRQRIPKKQMVHAWETGNYQGLDKFVPWDDLNEDLEPMARRLRTGLFDSSGIAIAQLPPIAATMRWDIENPRIRSYVDKNVGRLVSEIHSEAREHLSELVTRHFTKALTPREVGEEIVGEIGLHSRYRKAVRNYRRSLEEKGLPLKRIDAQVEKYSQRLMKARAMAIGRTETRRATNHGQREVWREAAAQGLIDKEKTRRIWVVDGNPCPICEAMDNEDTTLDEPFYSDDVGATEPGEAHPNCECIEVLEFE